MNGVIYARYSEGPHQNDQSIEGQVADCQEYATAHNINIIEIYADRHVSGKSITGRDEFQRMLADASMHKFECVIVWKVDRFGRDRQGIALSKIQLKKAGVKLMYAKESVPDGPEGIILESLLEGLAEYYSADLRQKVQRGIRESAKKGKVTGNVPLGFKLDSEHRPVIDTPVADAVAEAFRMHNSGCSIKEIRKMFDDHGIKSSRGNSISDSSVYNLLRNEKYCGKWTVADIPIKVEPIISQEVFDTAQTHFKPKKFNARGKAKVNYLLSCKVYCGYCGSVVDGVSGTGKSGKSYYYYKCSKKTHGGKCGLQPIPQDKLERAVITATCDKVLNAETIDYLSDRILAVQSEEPENAEIRVKQNELKENKKKQDNIIRAIEDGTTRGLTARLDELEREADALSVDIAKLKVHQPRLDKSMIKAWLNSFCDGDVENSDFRQKLVDTFISRIDLWNDHAIIYYNYTDAGNTLGSNTVSLVDLKSWYANTDRPLVLPDFFLICVSL